MAVITTKAIFGGVCPFVIGSIALRGQEPLARGQDVISRYMDDTMLPCRIKDIPSNQTSCSDGHHMIDCMEKAKFALDQWFLKVIQQWSRQHGASSVKANHEICVAALLVLQVVE